METQTGVGAAGWDYETDILVVGAGGAGLPAAVTAAEKGARVIILEKNSYCGGDALFAMVTMGARSRHARTANLNPPSTPLDIMFGLQTNNWLADTDILRNVLSRRDDTLDWLEGMGVVYDATHKWTSHMQAMGRPLACHLPINPERPEEGFSHWLPYNAKGFMRALEKRAHDLGITILTGTPVTRLLQEGGKVIGLEAQTKTGKHLRLKGRATLIAAGGFGANRDMIKEYALPRRAAAIAFYIGLPCNTGDGIRLGQAIGADLEAMDAQLIWDGGVQGIGEGPGAFYNAATQLVRLPSLTINKLGKRFFNEATMVGGFLFEGQANATQRQKDMTSFTIHDADTVQKQFICERFDPIFCEYPTPWFDKSFAKGVADGVIIKAETLDELARLLEVDATTLKATVAGYNAHCEKGVDAEYFKPASCLIPIRKAPFYAVKQVGGTLVATLGGLRVNDSMQVLDKEWRAIPGLYAAGQTTAWSGTLQTAFNTGRIAGENVAKEVLAG